MILKPIIPFEPVVAEELPKDENWIAQIKWDGVRILSYFDGAQINLVNRKLNNRTLQYPEFHVHDRFCKASSFILDGEIIAFNDKTPSFHEVMKRDSLRSKKTIEIGMNQTKVTYMIFDILFCNGEWVVDKMLHERQKILESIIIPQDDVQIVQNFADPEALYKLMDQYQMEGIIYKNLMSTYLINGKDRRWQKRKVYHDLFAAVGGFTLRGNIVNSLLLGLLDERNNFFYIGHAGTGKLTNQDWREITQRLESLITNTKLFINTPERSKDVVWVIPQMAVKVQFLEWTAGGTMRQPSIQAIVDVPLSQCSSHQLKG
ncbi:bifunctional non-homologous end joining protein LigD [Paenibacillus sp. yr247]|uniref:ATP-dependent DNA ligase n=1 Tax=Paenibacillus sp. yr247 TaxID=1761880 RepID=UPI0008880AFB|nr:DNA ligase [Paenibacillus sp. yr247]SDN36321.1 bifunctional non-homologous end joining protein LigD [Paenibacillus sp. yr247]